MNHYFKSIRKGRLWYKAAFTDYGDMAMTLIVDGKVVDENSHSFFNRAGINVIQTRTVISKGVSLGSAIAVTISWSINHSILWAILHGIFSWAYVLYYAIVR